MDLQLDCLSRSVVSARTVEELTRPLLETLEAVSGLESTYLTAIDLAAGVQRILYARNTGLLQIPEGAQVPWNDTLCKRALEEGRFFTDDVDACWGDSVAAKKLGIHTYLSTPVKLTDGSLYGTLCGASTEPHALPPNTVHVLMLFASLISQQVERENVVRQLCQANERLASYAATDFLTQLSNRRALQQKMVQLLESPDARDVPVLIAFVDLDGFKNINDMHGHDIGDKFLMELAARLRAILRAGDMAARIGGDEFVVVAAGPDCSDPGVLAAARQAFQERVFLATAGEYLLGDVRLDYVGASVGVLDVRPGTHDAARALRQADEQMYQVKRARRAAAMRAR
ncbi:MAG TPA: sensor domain-containing diguanylate cyclase [Bordetella sp.]|uniref:sensor domain-containing diguanylate cyclase n=1 Tax=Bordetella sp. TaxID=28081 RepID=UPI002ED518EE